jgi:hypothetical protein
MEQLPENMDDEILSILGISKEEPNSSTLKNPQEQKKPLENSRCNALKQEDFSKKQFIQRSPKSLNKDLGKFRMAILFFILFLIFATVGFIINARNLNTPIAVFLIITGCVGGFFSLWVLCFCISEMLKHKWGEYNWRVVLIGLAPFLLILSPIPIMGVNYVIRTVTGKAVIKPFIPHLSEYINLDQLKSDPESTPYIVGKVIFVDLYEYEEPNAPPRKIKTDFFAQVDMKWTKQLNYYEFAGLPSDLRASSPEEVGTIIWLIWDAKTEGVYSAGDVKTNISACRIVCRMKIIDRKRLTIVGEKEFFGGDPPKTKRISGISRAAYGSKPSSQIVKYIESLPRKPGEK